MHTSPTLIPPERFLETVYQELEYDHGCLLDASSKPPEQSTESDDWLEKGDWLTLAKSVGAETIFFVDNDPVIVFCKSYDNSPDVINTIYRRVWCMARPQCLFIATPGELKWYSLNQPPVRPDDEVGVVAPLEQPIQTLAEVSEKLQAYRREQVETGNLFVEKRFGNVAERADRRLIADLKVLRGQLLDIPSSNTQISPEIHKRHIHALIGRSIFVRYLEDREILEPDYFQQVANDKSNIGWDRSWAELLHTSDNLNLSPNSETQFFVRVLRNKDFTYALFQRLASDFNGDMFPNDEDERSSMTIEHLELLRRFLLGDTGINQRKLFLWAYDFEIVPIELISSIYEEFYQSTNDSESGTHYTPSVLVEYVLSETLTRERLSTRPKILDFACGSGIFLVQAFRRIVRHYELELQRPLTADELRQIIRDQIRGVEIKNEAVHIAAFSLYLALLHYQKPKSILAQIQNSGGQKPLPHLIWNPKRLDETEESVLYCASAFHLLQSERDHLIAEFDSGKRLKLKKERQALIDSPDTLPFEANSFDVIVGNPPWGYLKRNEGTEFLRREQKHTLTWCKVFDWKVGDKELSQAFVARSLSLLRSNGVCGLLVSAGLLLKQGAVSQNLRKSWLRKVTVDKVTNFTHVRHIYFSAAVSPFCYVQFCNSEAESTHHLEYWSAKRTAIVEQTRSVVLSLPDIHIARQKEFLERDFLWKTYWWGSHHDAGLVSRLNTNPILDDYIKELDLREPRSGFEGVVRNYKPQDSEWLLKFKELPVKAFRRYGELNTEFFISPPEKVNRKRSRYIYEGSRLLIKRGITQKENANGMIIARLEKNPYAFRNSIYAIRFDVNDDWHQQILLGILWSSVARYFFFMTAGSWGLWADELKLHTGILSLPVRFPKDQELKHRIVSIVDALQNGNFTNNTLFSQSAPNKKSLSELEQELDESIFDLYELTQHERNLILDLCEVGLEFFYRKSKSRAVGRVVVDKWRVGKIRQSLPQTRTDLGGYIRSFLFSWNKEVRRFEREFHWQLFHSPCATMLALVFTAEPLDTPISEPEPESQEVWDNLLKRLSESSYHPVSKDIYVDQMIRNVSDTQITIIKRNEQRLWTCSLGREDAEATLVQAMSRKAI